MFLVITGNPVSGFRHYGVFDSDTEAVEYATTTFANENWWVQSLTEVHPPVLKAAKKKAKRR